MQKKVAMETIKIFCSKKKKITRNSREKKIYPCQRKKKVLPSCTNDIITSFLHIIQFTRALFVILSSVEE
jgi:hypothetical protein